jgi:ABC-type nitrate/sulfonate/bicarbonate transport system substrate-binding protein
MSIRVAVPDIVSPSYFPLIASVELGLWKEEGLDATLELVYPVTSTYTQLREGEIDYVGGSAHAPLYAFDNWSGCKLLCALSQGMYWFLVVRADRIIKRGDLDALRGMKIGAAPGPADGLREMLRAEGIDPDNDLEIAAVPGTSGNSVSFGVTAADALARGLLDGFWANGMGAEVAVREGVGRVVIDARRGDGPAGAESYTFPALVTTDARIDERTEEVQGAIRAVMAAQNALRADARVAVDAARRLFPAPELQLIPSLIERDVPYYNHRIASRSVEALNRFAHRLGLLDDMHRPYEQVVATLDEGI